MSNKLDHIIKRIVEFRDQRDWLQYHDPKNLAEAISLDSAEMLEHFLWKTVRESKNPDKEKLESIKNEVADIFIFLISICDVLDIDILDIIEKKIEINSEKYPVEKARGSNKKYSEGGCGG